MNIWKNPGKYRRLFKVVHEHGPLCRKELIEKYGFSGRVHKYAEELVDERVFEPVPGEGQKILYRVTEEWEGKTYNQLMFFYEIQEEEDGATYGGWPVAGFSNVHTLYGLPHFFDLEGEEAEKLRDCFKRLDSVINDLLDIKRTIGDDSPKIAVLSTPPLQSTPDIMNLNTCLEHNLSEILLNQPNTLENMSLVCIAVAPSLTSEGFKNLGEEMNFRQSDILKKYFSENEIQFLVSFIKKFGNSLYGGENIIEKTKNKLLEEALSPGGICYDKGKMQVLERKIEYFRRRGSTRDDILSELRKTFQQEKEECIQIFTTYAYMKIKQENKDMPSE